MMMIRTAIALGVFICCVALNNSQTLKIVPFSNPPLLGRTLSVNPLNSSQTVPSEEVFFGSFSSLVYLGYQGNSHVFLSNTDRGPTAGSIRGAVKSGNKFAKGEVFVLPEYSPKFFKIAVDFDSGIIEMLEVINLFKTDGVTPLSGRPNLQNGTEKLAFTDAYPIDPFGNLLENDPLGADIEGLAVAADGTFWAVDEYRPSIYHFSQQGVLLDRFIPFGIPTESGQYGTAAIPEIYASRQENLGFEAVALEGDVLYAFLQRPLNNPNTRQNTRIVSRNVRVLGFNISSNSVVAEYVYVLNDKYNLTKKKVDKISDATSLGNGKFLVMERDSSSKKNAFKYIFERNSQVAAGDRVLRKARLQPSDSGY